MEAGEGLCLGKKNYNFPKEKLKVENLITHPVFRIFFHTSLTNSFLLPLTNSVILKLNSNMFYAKTQGSKASYFLQAESKYFFYSIDLITR